VNVSPVTPRRPAVPRVGLRTGLRSGLRTGLGVTVCTAALVLGAAGPVLAVTRDDGSETGSGFSVLETLLWFVGGPALLFVVIAILVSAPSMARGPRYRPGLGWWAAPVWFNGPDNADAAVRQAAPTTGGGGASARW
jgi:hypothetical protein